MHQTLPDEFDPEPEDVEAAAEASAEASEIEERRQKVIRCRMLRMTVRAIAKELGVDHSTIVRDLQWIRARSKTYFKGIRLDTAHRLGNIVMRLDVYESELYRAARTKGTNMPTILALKEARDTAIQQLAILQDLGLVQRFLGELSVKIPQAAELRAIRSQLAGQPLFDVDDAALRPPQQFIDVRAEPQPTATTLPAIPFDPTGGNGDGDGH